MKVEYITSKQWDACAIRIERKNLKTTNHSLSFVGIARRANKHIIETMHDSDIMIVTPGWRETMKAEGKQ